MKKFLFVLMILIGNITFAADNRFHVACTDAEGIATFERDAVTVDYPTQGELILTYINGNVEHIKVGIVTVPARNVNYQIKNLIGPYNAFCKVSKLDIDSDEEILWVVASPRR